MSVRPATVDDLSQLLEIYAPYVRETNYTFEYDVPDPESWRRRFCDITAQFPYLVWEEDGEILGYAHGSAPFSFAAYRWCAESSIYLRPKAQRRGIGSALYAALEGCLAAQGYRVIYALVTSSNIGSMEFHRRLGYKAVAELPDCGFKQGVWESVTWLEKRLCSPEKPEKAPTAFSTMVKNHSF